MSERTAIAAALTMAASRRDALFVLHSTQPRAK